jgi:hypothetical protein
LLEKINNKFYVIVVLLSFYISSLISYLTYDIMNSPDFAKYIQYFNYYADTIDSTNLEQGNLYFFLNYVLFLIFENINNLSPETNINLSVHLINNLFFLFGIWSLFLFLKQKNFQLKNICMTLSLLCFLPISFHIRGTLKPEILAFTLLSWILYYFSNYKINKNKLIFFKITLLSAILFTTKSSIAVIVGTVFLVELMINYRELFNRKNLSYILLLFSITSVLLIENYFINDQFITQVTHEEKYNNKASFEFLYNFNEDEFYDNPIKYSHYDSFLALTFFDTFGDIFGNYFNSEYSELNIERKEFLILRDVNDTQKIPRLQYEKEIKKFTFFANFEKIDLQVSTIDNLRNLYGFFLSLLFYSLLILQSFLYNKKWKVILLSPFFGIFFVVISALGIFGNNFDPNIGDSVKVFYFSFLLLLAFPISFCLLLEYIKKGTKTLTIVLLILFLFILGFPHAYGQETQDAFLSKNSKLVTCEINYPIIDNIFGFDEEKQCDDSKLNEFIYKTDFSNNFKFVFKNIPFVNLAVLIASLLRINIYEYFIKKDNH